MGGVLLGEVVLGAGRDSSTGVSVGLLRVFKLGSLAYVSMQWQH